ncbi:MAG: PTS ascorbate transporter subunit IIC [Oscillospiraceae bacterium]|nr:PTS ascorbate transporter subunit IIC [Oscillospiraceae bacterium]
MANPEDKKKQVPLRISDTLFAELSAWAKDDFRSLNGQIEYLLHECVKRRKGKGNKQKEENPPE